MLILIKRLTIFGAFCMAACGPKWITAKPPLGAAVPLHYKEATKRPSRLRFQLSNSTKAKVFLAKRGVTVIDGERELSVSVRYPLPVSPPQETDLRASFAIMHDHKDVVELIQRLKIEDEKSPTVIEAKLQAAFKPNYSRGFDLASRVARTMEGDCTEAALLLTAVLRRANIPAHVVLGNAVVRGENNAAYGHAWVEYYDGKEWKLGDIALYDTPKDAVLRYPLFVMRNESPAFSVDLMNHFAKGLPKAVWMD